MAAVSVVISLLAAALAFSLKWATEHFQEIIFHRAANTSRFSFIILPTIGITAVYFLRKIYFLKRRNKGITEIYKTLDQRKEHLPLFKIPSHYFNGFLTVIFGGSTGIEVSTVVATATIGNKIHEKDLSAKVYKRELICSGVCAGVAILFGSPIVGWLFAIEVIARKLNKSLFLACTAAALTSWGVLYLFPGQPLFSLNSAGWSWTAIPFMLLLSALAALLSIYFTVLVMKIKGFFSGINNNFIRVNLGALTVGGLIYFFPFLYGDSYHALSSIMEHPASYPVGLLLLLALLKPLAASLTLGAGGDGGVFAPGIVAGAFLGLAFALFCNTYLGTDLIPVNFILVGAAAMLSASIYAPFTALFLACGLIPNGFILFFPILLCSLTANYCSKWIFPYNVYTQALQEGIK